MTLMDMSRPQTVGRQTSRPTLSVVVPFYDEFSFLDRSIGSLLACADVVTEIILVNDSPAPETALRLQSLRNVPGLRILHNPSNLGAAGSRNEGIKAATGDYLMFLDADDVVSPAGLAEALAYAKRTGADILHLPSMVEAPRDGRFYRHYRDAALFGKRVAQTNVQDLPALRYGVANWSFLFRRAFLQRSGVTLDPEQRVAEDHLFILKALQATDKVATFDRWCHVWRRRGGSLSTAESDLAAQGMKLNSLTKALEFLECHYRVQDIAFQRDYAFNLLRFIWTWDFLPSLIPQRSQSPEAARLLDGLADVLMRYPFDPAVLDDAVARSFCPWPLTSSAGRSLTRAQVVEVIHLIRVRDWRGVLLKLTGDHQAGLAKLPDAWPDCVRVIAPFSRVALGSDGVVDRSLLTDWASDDAERIVAAADPAGIVLVLTSPVSLMWDRYAGDSKTRAGGVSARFCDHLLDDIDSLLQFPQRIASAAAQRGIALRVVLIGPEALADSLPPGIRLQPDAPPDFGGRPDTLPSGRKPDDYALALRPLMSALATMQQQMVASAGLAPGTPAIVLAEAATFGLAASVWRTAFGPALTVVGLPKATVWHSANKGMVGLAWQVAEDSMTGQSALHRSLHSCLVADQLRYGDAAPDGRRTLKSRARFVLRKPRSMARRLIQVWRAARPVGR